MSIGFLDEITLYDNQKLHSLAIELTNGSLMEISNPHKRSTTIPENVGILSLDHFIYILIGVLVFLCCSFSLWEIAKAMRDPRKYFDMTRSETHSHVASPYRETKPPAPGRVSAAVRGEIGKLRTQPIYQADGFVEPSLMAKPNLPIPVIVKTTSDAKKTLNGIGAADIEAWGVLVKEKESLNIKIANLERLNEARKQAGEMGAMSPKLLAALQRRADVENSINATYEGFKQRRGEWSEEEWQTVELIMRYSPMSR